MKTLFISGLLALCLAGTLSAGTLEEIKNPHDFFTGPRKQWLNRGIVFLPKPTDLQEYGYPYLTTPQNFQANASYALLVGKRGNLESVFQNSENASEIFWKIRVDTESGPLYVWYMDDINSQKKRLEDTAWVYILEALNAYQHMKLYAKEEIDLHSFDSDSLMVLDEKSITLPRLTTVIPLGAVAGTNLYPHLLEMKTLDGRTGFLPCDSVKSLEANFIIGDLKKLFPDASDKLIAYIKNQKVATTMTQEMVLLAWGEPVSKSSIVQENDITDIWEYSSTRLIFKNDSLVDIKEK